DTPCIHVRYDPPRPLGGGGGAAGGDPRGGDPGAPRREGPLQPGGRVAAGGCGAPVGRTAGAGSAFRRPRM
ncbi:MAG: hypothetical protein AVDCRST_MAG68-5653, partial [uncultured Gemmatimonadetes bacterium]